MSLLESPAPAGTTPAQEAYTPVAPAYRGRESTALPPRLESLLVVVSNADPAGEIMIGIEGLDGAEARFETSAPFDCGVVVGRGRSPEFVAVDPGGLTVAMGNDHHFRGEPIVFSILLTVSGDADLERFRLTAVAAPGTELEAVFAKRAVQPFSGGSLELAF